MQKQFAANQAEELKELRSQLDSANKQIIFLKAQLQRSQIEKQRLSEQASKGRQQHTKTPFPKSNGNTSVNGTHILQAQEWIIAATQQKGDDLTSRLALIQAKLQECNLQLTQYQSLNVNQTTLLKRYNELFKSHQNMLQQCNNARAQLISEREEKQQQFQQLQRVTTQNNELKKQLILQDKSMQKQLIQSQSSQNEEQLAILSDEAQQLQHSNASLIIERNELKRQVLSLTDQLRQFRKSYGAGSALVNARNQQNALIQNLQAKLTKQKCDIEGYKQQIEEQNRKILAYQRGAGGAGRADPEVTQMMENQRLLQERCVELINENSQLKLSLTGAQQSE